MPVARRVIGSSEGPARADELSPSAAVADLETGGGRPGAANGDDEASPLLLPRGPPALLSATESGGPPSDGEGASAEVVSTILAFNDLVVLQRGVFLLVQGVLAGFAFTTLYLRQSTVRRAPATCAGRDVSCCCFVDSLGRRRRPAAAALPAQRPGIQVNRCSPTAATCFLPSVVDAGAISTCCRR